MIRNIFFLLIGSLSLFAQSLDTTLDELANFKQESKPLYINYSPFSVEAAKAFHSGDDILDSIKITSSEPTLKAIFNRKAFIDDRWYSTGDKIGKYEIKKIYINSVALQDNNLIKTLHLDTSKMYLKVKEK
jgi:2-oxoglutarate dehydrogenase complex dehydrogenase (E1) component-like enzyme